MFRRREPVPPDLAFLSAEDWPDLARQIDRVAKRLGGRRDGSVVRFGADKVLNLGNLARVCAQLPPEAWPAEIERFLSVFKVDLSPLDVIRADPTAARRQLRVRPYPEGAFADVPFPVVSRPLAGELLDVLCLDFPEQVAIVNAEMAAAFGATENELLELGLANVRAERPPELVDQVGVEGVTVDLFHGESFYAATWGRWADALVQDIGEHGALVAMPYRHQVLVHALHTGSGAATAPGLLLWLAHAGISDGPGPVSPDLFWWRAGRLSHLLGAIVGDEVHFAPTNEYLEATEILMLLRPA